MITRADPLPTGPARDDGLRVEGALRAATTRLSAAGIEAARRDARLLLSAIVPGGAPALLRDPDRLLSASEAKKFEAAVLRREKREPVSRILGEREFWSLKFEITPDTLDPRPDSETLVEAILDWVEDRTAALRILDLGTGSGCLLLALLSELPNALGTGVDMAEPALAVARRNAANLGLSGRSSFVQNNWTAGLAPGWDIILSNPPYVSESEIAGLEPEVTDYDPLTALAAGPDGLDDYRILIPGAAALLRPGGLLALEVGAGQSQAVEDMILAQGLVTPWRRCDLSGVERCCFAVKAKK